MMYKRLYKSIIMMYEIERFLNIIIHRFNINNVHHNVQYQEYDAKTRNRTSKLEKT